MYYNQLLHEQGDNIKSTWQTLNALIKKSKQSSFQSHLMTMANV